MIFVTRGTKFLLHVLILDCMPIETSTSSTAGLSAKDRQELGFKRNKSFLTITIQIIKLLSNLFLKTLTINTFFKITFKLDARLLRSPKIVSFLMNLASRGSRKSIVKKITHITKVIDALRTAFEVETSRKNHPFF